MMGIIEPWQVVCILKQDPGLNANWCNNLKISSAIWMLSSGQQGLFKIYNILMHFEESMTSFTIKCQDICGHIDDKICVVYMMNIFLSVDESFIFWMTEHDGSVWLVLCICHDNSLPPGLIALVSNL